jgi:hypothetical protein
VTTVRRVRLHRRVAEVLAARSGDVSEIDRHRFAAAARGAGAEAAEALEHAAKAALDALAYETAAAHSGERWRSTRRRRARLLLRRAFLAAAGSEPAPRRSGV